MLVIDQKKYLTIKEICKKLSRSYQSIAKDIRDLNIPKKKLGKVIYVLDTDLSLFLK